LITMMDIMVIGVVGHIGSGKDEALKYLNAKYGIPYLSIGDMVRRLAAEKGLELTRDNLQILAGQYLRERGKEYFTTVAAEEIINNGWKIAGISGVRTPDDARTLREFFEDNFILLYIKISDPRTRFERLFLRHQERDPRTFEEFEEQDANEEKIFKINETITMANFSVTNDGTLAEYQKQLDMLVESKKLHVP
jgi:dephospho-CoA kinase